MKTNFDGAMFEELNEVGLEVVVRNPQGKNMATLSQKNTKAIFGSCAWNTCC